jgi:hypothetical protein
MAHDLMFGKTRRDFGRGSVGAGTPENTTLREVLTSTKKDVKEGAARGVAPVQRALGITSRRGLVKAGVVAALGIGAWVALTPREKPATRRLGSTVWM